MFQKIQYDTFELVTVIMDVIRIRIPNKIDSIASILD